MWPAPVALVVALIALHHINENTAHGFTRRSLLYPGGGLLIVIAGTLAFLWWMRETRSHRAAESAGPALNPLCRIPDGATCLSGVGQAVLVTATGAVSTG